MRKKCIPFWNHLYSREDDFISFSISEKLFIYLRASTNISFFDIFTLKVSIEFSYRVQYRKSLMSKFSSCQDDIFTTRKDASYRLEGLTPHDDRMPLRCLTKMLKILRNMPWDFSLISDDTVFRHSSDSDVVDFLWLCHCEERSNACSEYSRVYFFLLIMQKLSENEKYFWQKYFIIYTHRVLAKSSFMPTQGM